MGSYLREFEGKSSNDPFFRFQNQKISGGRDHGGGGGVRMRRVWVPGPVIVGAGPAGLAAAACLKERGVPSEVLEKSNGIASLWKLRTYERLRLHLPKQFCELPFMPFPADFPMYPTRHQFVRYLEDYVERFDIRPRFNQAVVEAEYDRTLGFWRVRTKADRGGEETEYVCRWLIVATGENAEAVVPEIEGMEEFGGSIKHSNLYRDGQEYEGKKVLVIGCGNSGMEVSLDLCDYSASPFLVVRNKVHVLPREMLGRSTFGLSMWLLKWFPIRFVDAFLLILSRLLLGDTAKLGLTRPTIGPITLKNICGKTPVLDVGTLAKIKSGHIKVRPDIKRLKRQAVEFVDGRIESFDSIIMATGYKSNVPSWLKEGEMFGKNGIPLKPFPSGWKGENGLYAAGFTNRGILGATIDAKKIAEDIERCWKAESKLSVPTLQSLPST